MLEKHVLHIPLRYIELFKSYFEKDSKYLKDKIFKNIFKSFTNKRNFSSFHFDMYIKNVSNEKDQLMQKNSTNVSSTNLTMKNSILIQSPMNKVTLF